MSWLSPAFPVGAFSYSHGLEYAVEAGLVCDEATLESWVRTCLAQEFAPVSGLLLRAAYGAVAARDSQALSVTLAEARALVPTPEFELECQGPGHCLYDHAAGRLAPGGGAKGHGARPRQGWISYASAVGIAAAAADIPLKPTLAAFLSCGGKQPVVGGRAPDPAGPDRRAAHPGAAAGRRGGGNAGRADARGLQHGSRRAHNRMGKHPPRNPIYKAVSIMSTALRVGVGGPVGSGKTALMDRLCKTMRDSFDIAAITNDIYTREDAEFLTRSARWRRSASRG